MTPPRPAPDARPDVYLGRHLEWVRRTLARREPDYRFKWDIYFDRLEELALTATRFLDAGCGDNKTATELIGPRIRVGIDVERDAQTSATEPGQRIVGKLEQLPFQYGSFDLVGCRHVVEHLDDPLTVFSELARVIAPGGHLLVQTVNRSSLLVAFTRILGTPVRRWIRRHRYGRSDADPFPLRDLFNRPALLESPPAGFRLVSLEMTQDVDLQSRIGFWLSYLLVLWTKNRPNRRSTITAEWERI